ncbi:hypothetical protein PQO01_05095 [Lentisphaera marina]|uniref:hypothetical protein n=1 Tax=Lentisphaera marina TaxID=1111041 RepID=UPI0023673569|nr:hypothetical protein [Lentisphaera marina]MDD7984321.1 hypothetical protein [Lentisphaera marina]
MLIGDAIFEKMSFENTDDIISNFCTQEFLNKSSIIRNELVNKTLLELIEAAPRNSFLLREVIDYAAKITESHILDGKFNITAFERWLNQHSGLNEAEQFVIRGKISGKHIPRDEYQLFFPIGHDKYYPNSHYITAHNPPDLDSTTGSFIGWLDAFSCKVGQTLTVWNVPQGEPSPLIAHFFNKIFTPNVFSRVAKHKSLISPVAMDIVNQHKLIRVTGNSNIRDFQHERNTNHIIVVDEDGFYLGDWRVSDVDTVGRIQRLLNMTIHSYEKVLISSFTSLMSRDTVTHQDIKSYLDTSFNANLGDSQMSFQRYHHQDCELLDLYLKKVLKLEHGSKTTFLEFFRFMDEVSQSTYCEFVDHMNSFLAPENFDFKNEVFTLARSKIFSTFNKAFDKLSDSIQSGRNYYDRMDLALAVKKEVLGNTPNYVSTKAEPTEIKQKLRGYQHVTVCFLDKKQRIIPVGVIHRSDMLNDSLGSVTLRDFCNSDEIKIAPSVRTISAIDHHRSEMNSRECMTITIADVQSVNVLLAEQAFTINDRYGCQNQSLHSIEEQMEELRNQENLNQEDFGVLNRLVQKKQAIYKSGVKYFINPERELIEYSLMLNAIIDDTDLFNKCAWRDLTSIANLVNRMKSIVCRKEIQVLSIDKYNRSSKADLKAAINEFLNNEDVMSFYKNIFDHREVLISQWLADPKDHFYCYEDRKIQNEFCAISQLKIFPNNRKCFTQHRDSLLESWLNSNEAVARKSSVVDFFLQMNSTIETNDQKDDAGCDEVWIRINSHSEQAESRLRIFFSAFTQSRKYPDSIEEVIIEGANTNDNKALTQIIRNDLKLPFTVKDNGEKRSIICLKIKQSSLNSRKADITPFLPK